MGSLIQTTTKKDERTCLVSCVGGGGVLCGRRAANCCSSREAKFYCQLGYLRPEWSAGMSENFRPECYVRLYAVPVHDLALLGCNGVHHWRPQDYMETAAPGRAFYIGSIVVLPGCTFTGFRDVNYRGPTYVLEGPVVQSHINFNAGFNHDHGEVGWFGSFVATCEQQLPNCVASDSWVTVGSLDNSQSAFPAEYTYQHTVGTEFSKSTQHSVDISSQVSTEVKSKFFGFFKGKLGVSVKTGYDWTRVSSEATSEVVTTEVKIMIPPHEKVQLDRATGTCGGSVVHTELMRTVSSKPSSFKASPRVEYWTGDNILL